MPRPNRIAERRVMVESQLTPSGINHPDLLAGFLAVPREAFLPTTSGSMHALAYADTHIAFGHSDSGKIEAGAAYVMLSPFAGAKLLQAADIRPTDNILIAGDPTGYLSVVASFAAASVISVVPADLRAPVELDIGRNNLATIASDLNAGWPSEAPYDKIIFGTPVAQVPQSYIDQLAAAEDGDRGGQLIALVVGESHDLECLTRLTIVTRHARGSTQRESERITVSASASSVIFQTSPVFELG